MQSFVFCNTDGQVLQSVLSTTCNGSSTVVPKTTTSRSGVRSEVMRGSTSEQTQCSIKTRIFVNGAQKKTVTKR